MIAIFLSTTLALAAPAPEEITGPPPIPTHARMVDGKVHFEVTVTQPVQVPEQRVATVIENGVAVTKTYTVVVTVFQTMTVSKVAGDDLQAIDTTGARVARERLADLLKGRTPVLLSADGKPVSPTHLRQAKPGTLILVVPSHKTNAAGQGPSGTPPSEPAPARPK